MRESLLAQEESLLLSGIVHLIHYVIQGDKVIHSFLMSDGRATGGTICAIDVGERLHFVSVMLSASNRHFACRWKYRGVLSPISKPRIIVT